MHMCNCIVQLQTFLHFRTCTSIRTTSGSQNCGPGRQVVVVNCSSNCGCCTGMHLIASPSVGGERLGRPNGVLLVPRREHPDHRPDRSASRPHTLLRGHLHCPHRRRLLPLGLCPLRAAGLRLHSQVQQISMAFPLYLRFNDLYCRVAGTVEAAFGTDLNERWENSVGQSGGPIGSYW